MLENAIYSVISPEGCATILWRDPKKTLEASKAMKLSAKDLFDLKIIDEIISEPLGGAHRNPEQSSHSLKTSIVDNLEKLLNSPTERLIEKRYDRLMSYGSL